jgi:hypothetical protein
MRKIRAIKSSYPSEVDGDIQRWIDQNPTAYIISVSGAIREDGDTVTYILYEERKTELELLNS